MTRTKTAKKTKKTTKTTATKPRSQAKDAASGSPLPIIGDLVSRARQLQERRLAQVQDLRLRIEDIDLDTRIEQGREQIDALIEQINERVLELRGDLWHRLGLASLEDLKKMNRQLKAVRSKLQGVQRQVRDAGAKDAA